MCYVMLAKADVTTTIRLQRCTAFHCRSNVMKVTMTVLQNHRSNSKEFGREGDGKNSTPFPTKFGWIGSGMLMNSLVFRAFFFFGVKFDVNLCKDSPMRGKKSDFRLVGWYFWYRQFAASRYPAVNKQRNTIFSNLQPACVVRCPQTLHGGRACRALHKRCQPFFDLITCRILRSGKLTVLNLLTGQK